MPAAEPRWVGRAEFSDDEVPEEEIKPFPDVADEDMTHDALDAMAEFHGLTIPRKLDKQDKVAAINEALGVTEDDDDGQGGGE